MYCVSVSYKKAPVAIREKFSFSPGEREGLVRLLVESGWVGGCVVLSTCNRSEVYASCSKGRLLELQRRVAEYKGLPLEQAIQYFNVYGGDKAIAHLFKVCCGFDSLVVGEDEILGQVKEAYQASMEGQKGDYELHVAFQRAIACAKRVKTDTNLSRTPVSVATLVANQVFRFEKDGPKTVLVIGMSGKIGSSIAKNLLAKPGIQVVGTVRKHKAGLLVESGNDRVKVIDYHDRYSYMDEADMVVSATLGPHYTVTYERLKQAVHKAKPRLFMDVAVPMDMDPEVGRMEGLTLRDIDFFETLSKKNGQIKQKELDLAQEMMEEDLDQAIKEVAFHPYIRRLPEFKQVFEEKPLETILFHIRDHVNSDDWKVILNTFDHLGEWIREG